MLLFSMVLVFLSQGSLLVGGKMPWVPTAQLRRFPCTLWSEKEGGMKVEVKMIKFREGLNALSQRVDKFIKVHLGKESLSLFILFG